MPDWIGTAAIWILGYLILAYVVALLFQFIWRWMNRS